MIKPVYALVGSDSFLQLQKLAEILAQMPPDVQRIDIEGERAELRKCSTNSAVSRCLAGEKSSSSATAKRSSLASASSSKTTSPARRTAARLVLRVNTLPATQRIHKAIVKVGKIEDCNPPKDVVRWIVDQAKSTHQITLQLDAARLLAELIGDDLGRLDSELAKLALQTDDGKVGIETISGSVSFQREQEMWDMTTSWRPEMPPAPFGAGDSSSNSTHPQNFAPSPGSACGSKTSAPSSTAATPANSPGNTKTASRSSSNPPKPSAKPATVELWICSPKSINSPSQAWVKHRPTSSDSSCR